MQPIINHKVIISKSETRDVLIKETSELVQEPAIQKIEFVTDSFSQYVQMYYAFFNILTKCNLDNADIHVLTQICIHTDLKGEIWLHTDFREEVSKKLNLHIGTVNNAISKLCKNPAMKDGETIGVDYTGPILMRVRKGGYRVNPLFVHKGSTSDRMDLVSSFFLTYKQLHPAT